MPEGPLRKAINRWLKDAVLPDSQPGFWGRAAQRWKEAQAIIFEIRDANRVLFTTNYLGIFVNRAAYALTGDQGSLDRLEGFRDMAIQPSLSELLAKAIREGLENPATREIAEIFGAVVTEPVLSLFESYAGRDDLDPIEFARAFHGFMITLNVSGGLADTALETLTAGQVEGAGRMLESMYWSLGLGFLGWQTLAPLLSSGLQPGLERYYKDLYRPARFSASDLRDLFALGRISRADLEAEARKLGWRDKDISQWIELAYKPLSQGDVFQAFHGGLITQAQAATRLRVLGYSPDDLGLLFQLNQDDQALEERQLTASTARQAYRSRLISAADLRAALAALRYSDREINLILALDDARIAADMSELTTGQIKAAWVEGVLTDPEALHWLTAAGVGDDTAAILLRTWQSEIAPEFRKLNLSTITGAYVTGILQRSAAKERLVNIGLAPDDAELELRLAELRNPEAFGQGAASKARKLTLANLRELALVGLVALPQLEARLIEIGYTSDDAALLTGAIRAQIENAGRPLTQSTIERAYLAGVINRASAEAELDKIGYTPDQTLVIINTLERENRGTFSLPPEERGRLLTAGTLQDLFIRNLISESELLTRLEGLGLAAVDAELLAAEASLIREGQAQPLNVSLIERAYLAGVLDRERAAEKLAELDYTPENIEAILSTIELENAAAFSPGLIQSLRLPSISELTAALQNTIISEAEFLARAIELGYTPDDASLYLALATRTERKGVKTLSQGQVSNAYGAGLIPRGEAMARLYSLGYNDTDATLLLRMEKDFIQLTDTWAAFLGGALDFADTISSLIEAKYSDQDIVDAFASLPPGALESLGYTLQEIIAGLANIPGGE